MGFFIILMGDSGEHRDYHSDRQVQYEEGNRMTFAWVVGGIIAVIVLLLTFFVTRKAYSRKWELDEPGES